MKLISEPPIPVKIQKMKQRVRWMHPSIVQRGIDQTCMVLDDGRQDSPEFSFIVIGDTGSKSFYGHHPQRKIAELMLAHSQGCSFILHTGDVIYMVGSREYYLGNFIEPYREFLVGGDHPQSIPYDQMVFSLPFLPVLGNHDYYDVPLMYRWLTGSTLPLRRLLRYKDIEIGWHSSNQGDAYARAFLDYMAVIASTENLEQHLDQHYTAKSDTGRCLRYEPGRFTRLPNRYYTFRYGGIDFFALDSNTFNAPSPLPTTKVGETHHWEWEQRHWQIDQEELQRSSHKVVDVDLEQLQWLENRLVESWHNSQVRGRVIYFHHPPYVTEKTKWHQAQTLAVRHRLRWVFAAVAETLGSLVQERPIVDLILNGHAHCLEYLRTVDTGYADSHINCIISGGGGHRPRRQREEGPEIMETFREISGSPTRKVADSLLFVGRYGHSSQKRLPYSCVRIDVKDGCPPKFIVKPLIAECMDDQWCEWQMEAFEIPQ